MSIEVISSRWLAGLGITLVAVTAAACSGAGGNGGGSVNGTPSPAAASGSGAVSSLEQQYEQVVRRVLPSVVQPVNRRACLRVSWR